jgi:hypothetical protein
LIEQATGEKTVAHTAPLACAYLRDATASQRFFVVAEQNFILMFKLTLISTEMTPIF